jgi:hypothetical protein
VDSKKALQHENRININDKDEVLYWARLFGVSEEELRTTMQRVGDTVDAVAAALEEGKTNRAA